MMNTNEELASMDLNAFDCSSKDAINTESVLQNPKKRRHRIFPHKVHDLRKNSGHRSVSQLPNGNNYLNEFCKLVCKPVSVRLIRLTDQDLTKLTRKVSFNVAPVRRTPLDKSLYKFHEYKTKRRKSTFSIKKHRKDWKQVHTKTESNEINKNVDNNVNENVQKSVNKNVAQNQPKRSYKKRQLKGIVTSKVQKSNKNEQCKEDLLKTIKQPIIVLNRIDEVINKLAQSFARVTSNKQYYTVEQSTVKQHIAVTQTEEVGLMPEPSLIITNGNDCLQNEQIADNISEADSDDISQIKRKFKRKNTIFDDSNSESDSDVWYETKRSKLSFSEKETAMTDDKYNEEDVQARTFQELCVSPTLNELSSEKNIEADIVNGETLTDNEKVNVENNEVDVEERYLDIQNVEVNNRNGGIDLENSNIVEVQEKVNVENEDVNVENEDVNVENEDVNVENEDVNVENEDVNVENEDVDVENEGVSVENEGVSVENEGVGVANEGIDVENEDTDVEKGDLDIRNVEANNRNKEMNLENMKGVEVQEEVDVENRKENFENEEAGVENQEVDVGTKNGKCNLNESESVVEESTESPTEDSVSSLLSSELCFEHTSKPDTCSIDESIHKNSEMEQYILKPLLSENELIQKYKLHKQPKICLVDCQRIKRSSGMSCSKNVAVKSKIDKSVCAHKIIRGRKGSVEREYVSNKSMTSKKGKIYKMTSDSIIGHGHKSSPKKDQLEDVSIGNHKTDTEKAMLSCVYITSPTKHKKLAEKKDTIKPKEVSSTYKCIVCDLFFEKYSVLQQHLSTHTKQTTQSQQKITVSEKHADAKEKLQSSLSTPEKTDLQQSLIENSTSEVAFSCSPCINGDQKESQHKSLYRKIKDAKSKQNLSRKHKICKPSKLTNECSVCMHEFATRADLAAHIFLHTETELKEAYKAAKLNMQKNDVNIAESETQRTKDSVTKPTHSVEKSPMNSNESKTSGSEAPTVQSHMEHIPKDAKSVNEKVNDTSKISKLTHRESNSDIQLSPLTNNVAKVKTSKKSGTNKTLFTICQCHNTADTNFSCLQIEIVLLCHTCGVLFRSMECFETHYRLPEYSACNLNRQESGRSPNLFCATCGMIFSSVQDVRQHLEMHVRFKKDCTMDFRCNICKVMFIGIGPLFYRHWVNHTKDPFWVASEQSFPKTSVLNLKSKKLGVASNPGEVVIHKCLDNYIHVAEHVCLNCKVAFNKEDHLKEHELNCKGVSVSKSPNAKSNVTTDLMLLKLHLICSLCNSPIPNKTELYSHMKNKHKFATDPQFVCVSLTNMAKTFICNVCMAISATIEKFNEHWFNHYVSQPYFECTYCQKFCESLDAFKDHTSKHVLASNNDIITISCRVHYRKVKHVCKPCCIGFTSEKLLNEHSIIHNAGNVLQNRNSNEATTTTDKASDKGNKDLGEQAGKGDQPTDDQADKEDDVLEEQIDKGDQATEKKIDERNQVTQEQTAQCSKSKADLEKEKLINILEGNEEEDSENELVIDLADRTELQNELAVTDRSKEKQVVCSSTLSTSNTASQPTPHPNKTAETNNPMKQKHGFLRVKKLEELLEDISSLHECQICKYSCGSTEELQEHLLTHAVQEQAKVPSEEASQQLAKFTEQNIGANKPLQNGERFAKNVQIPILSKLYPGTATNVKLLTVNHNPLVPSSQASVKTAYHKNLPACNIVRKLTVPRSIIQTIGKVPTAVERGSSNAQSPQAAPRVDSDTRNQQSSINTSVCNANSYIPHRTNVSKRVNRATTRSKNKYVNQLEGYKAYSKSNPAISMVYRYSKDGNGKIKVAASHSIDNAVANNNVNYTNGNQSYIQTSHNVQNQARTNNPPTTMYYQYPNSNTVYTANGQGPVQTQQVVQQVPNHTLARAVPSAIYCKNPTSGGMSIVINQNAPTVQSLPAVDVRQQQGHQQHIYQPVYSNPMVSVDPYVAQSQNIIDYSGTGELYRVTSNEYTGPLDENVPSCNVPLQTAPSFFCTYCPTVVSFVSQDLFNMHMSIYHNFVCEICNLSFYHVEDMRVHKMKHGLN